MLIYCNLNIISGKRLEKSVPKMWAGVECVCFMKVASYLKCFFNIIKLYQYVKPLYTSLILQTDLKTTDGKFLVNVLLHVLCKYSHRLIKACIRCHLFNYLK